MDFETAFKKPFTDVKKLLIGILLSIVPIVNFISMGFMLETAKRTMKRDNELPEWQGWGDLFVKGLMIAVIEVLYFLPAIITAIVFIWPMISAAFTILAGGQVPNMAQLFPNAGAMILPFIAAGLLCLFAAYIAPSAIMHYLNGGFGDAFSFGSVLKKAFTGSYFVAWTVFVVYSAVLSSVLSYVPYVGGAAATFIAGITGFSLFGEVFSGGIASAPRAVEAPVKAAAKAKKRK